MMSKEKELDSLFEGLNALSASSFPKKCANCGAIYRNVEEYASATDSVHGQSGLKASEDDDGQPILELFRNCSCGSTLLDFFKDRRGTAEQRLLFDTLLEQVCHEGFDRNFARKELIKIKKGKASSLPESLKHLNKNAPS